MLAAEEPPAAAEGAEEPPCGREALKLREPPENFNGGAAFIDDSVLLFLGLNMSRRPEGRDWVQSW